MATLTQTTPLSSPATVIANLGDGTFLVEQAGRGLTCRQAASCLLLPETGDQVLLATAGGAGTYLLAVLERAGSLPIQLQLGSDATISCTGSLQVQAMQKLSLEGSAFALRADEGDVTVEKLRYTGVLLQGAIGSLRLIAQACETIADRLVWLTKVSLRRVEQIDQVRAGQIDYEGTARVRIRSKYTAVTAKNLIKAKAKQVHIG
ncbi:Protein of unknown function [Andreprevotia lacus DSM 23236]|jgi:hypothetical protein|uniref:Uncharacterized protein n=1 Tax=Andreprevotia lacus DSM 23236 TaxID=1121001 RepID=A0A1W1XJ87_9NEIS|nr:DUF3540 domain-containing protein [Andreprevotia lacus]SMC23887.1 Protein of unknown function [Andreprevotia lacus DSM 23236]